MSVPNLRFLCRQNFPISLSASQHLTRPETSSPVQNVHSGSCYTDSNPSRSNPLLQSLCSSDRNHRKLNGRSGYSRQNHVHRSQYGWHRGTDTSLRWPRRRERCFHRTPRASVSSAPSALEGLRKAHFIASLGIPQFLFLPPIRPQRELLRRMGFDGPIQEQLLAAKQSAPRALSAAFSSAFYVDGQRGNRYSFMRLTRRNLTLHARESNQQLASRK